MNGDDQEVGLGRRQYYWSTPGPFSQPGNIFLFFSGGDRGRTLDALVGSVRDGVPLMRVHGERGSGKTLLGLVLADRLSDRCNVIRVEHEALNVGMLLQQLGIELCPSMTTPVGTVRRGSDMTPAALAVARVAVASQLASSTPGNRPVLLLVDSPDRVDADVLALLDELSTICRDGRRMLQAVLFERSEATASSRRRPVGAPAHRGAARHARSQAGHDGARAAFRAICHEADHHWLRRLTLAETGEYLRHQMMLFDYNRRDVFSREMAYFVADRSEGVFRGINTIARNAFVIAGLENEERPRMSHLLMAGLPPQAATEPRTPFVRRHRRAVFALFASSVVVSLLSAILLAAR